MPTVRGKHIVLGVSGSIACYKAIELASKLIQAEAIVHVAMTSEAAQFISPLTFQSITHRPVARDLFDPGSELAMDHVALAQKADLIVVAPATANIIAKLSHGMADDAVTTTVLASRSPTLIAPAMDGNMWQNHATQENIERLRSRGVAIAGPVEGRLASGMLGMGRMIEPLDIVDHIRATLGFNGDLSGKKIVVSAGGTQEPVDPVRVITNHSSGKMGFALARAARDQGASTVLITAPTTLHPPVVVEIVETKTARDMSAAVEQACEGADVLIMAAAVSDYRPKVVATQKLKKKRESFSLELIKNPDIITNVKGPIIKIGFAAETQDIVRNARKKMDLKHLDLIVANDITDPASGFGSDSNQVIILDRAGNAETLPLLDKGEVAYKVIERVKQLLS
ncbi:bifunctional phosphopantothenoylcysteine decarboxylase/phosphopantothenate--cysteine ligase CoaBC [SAR202 cluster bacterium AD-804-J14_MRT_500m]|nr:bifunctional phosphopantothenoylcysteine decarboxylase/phosphopantothenate--cysteine ligase CoaBC [SAR202 cluster bacterium AD-804-J14_MRT_500m]